MTTSSHKPSQRLLDVLSQAGWTITARPWPGHAIMSHPASGAELPTPEYMKGNPSWPFETYYKLRQLTFNYDGDRITAVFTRECAAPWVAVSERKISFKRATEYVQEEWS